MTTRRLGMPWWSWVAVALFAVFLAAWGLKSIERAGDCVERCPSGQESRFQITDGDVVCVCAEPQVWKPAP